MPHPQQTITLCVPKPRFAPGETVKRPNPIGGGELYLRIDAVFHSGSWFADSHMTAPRATVDKSSYGVTIQPGSATVSDPAKPLRPGKCLMMDTAELDAQAQPWEPGVELVGPDTEENWVAREEAWQAASKGTP